MPNLGKVLKDEIRRLARSETRRAVSALKRDSVQLKKHVADLRRRMQAIEKRLRLIEAAEQRLRQATVKAKVVAVDTENARVSSRTVLSLRRKFGLSQQELATLVGVTPQSIYNWERKGGPIKIHDDSRVRLLELRHLGVKEVRRRLEQQGAA